jgi:hypothetical protein
MGSFGYAQELDVNFVKVDGIAVVINVRGFEKRLEASPEQAEEIKEMNLELGEKVRLAYLDKITWRIKKINLDITREKYFGEDE